MVGCSDLEKDFFAPAQVVAVAEKPGDLGDLASDAHWAYLEPDSTIRPWTDDFSSVLTAAWRHLTR